MVDNTVPKPDPETAHLFRGDPVGPNETARQGGPYLIEAAKKARGKAKLGG